MNTLTPRSLAWRLSAASVLVSLIAGTAQADPPAAPARVIGAAVPGGAIISARSVVLTPTVGGPATAVPLGADGSFRAEGLTPGHYVLRVSSVSVPRQTQGVTFGEKVNQGLAQAGGALASGAQRSGTAPAEAPPASSAAEHLHKGGVVHRDLATRMSMNVTTPRQGPRVADVDGDGLDVEVASDGVLTGRATAQP